MKERGDSEAWPLPAAGQGGLLNQSLCALREWQPTPAFPPAESHGQRSLVGYSLWGCMQFFPRMSVWE